jgi:F-type H+-transporting ATPase subunit b
MTKRGVLVGASAIAAVIAATLVGSGARAQYDDEPAGKAPAAKAPAAKAPAPPAAKAPSKADPPAAPAAPPSAAPAGSARPGGSAAPAGSVNPATGLPSWHPPIGAPPPPPPPPTRGARGQRPNPAPSKGIPFPPPAQNQKRDAHGLCPGETKDDPPKNVNLFHGWLGSKDEASRDPSEWRQKAILAPPRKAQETTGWFAQRFGSWDWWKWRLIPFPYRYESHQDECDQNNTPIPLLANLINFGALLLLLNWLGKKPLAEALKKRKATIMSEIDRAREIKKSAEERLEHYQSELDHLEDKLATLRSQYAVEGELEEKRLRDELTSARDRMLADVAFRLDQEGKTARDVLSREALEGALGAAEKLLGHTVDPSDHDRLCEEFLDRIGPALARGKTGGA